MDNENTGGLLMIEGGTLIDGTGGPPINDSAVLIEGEKIIRVGRKGEVEKSGSTRAIDATGKFLLPGLIDIHVHYDGWMGEMFLAHGVTTVKDMGNDIEWMSEVSRQIEAGEITGPRIFYVGNGLDAPPPVRDHHVGLGSPDEARRAVAALHEKGAIAIKVREKITAELLRAITEEAHGLGIPVTGHIELMDAREAAHSGIDGLEHATGIVKATTSISREDGAGLDEIRRHIEELKLYSLIDMAKVPELVGELVDKGVALIPTLANWWRMASKRRDDFASEDAQYASDPSLTYIPQDVRGLLATSFVFNIKNEEDLRHLEEGYWRLQASLRAHHEAGGRVLAGSDTFFSVPGLSMQRELIFLTDAGFSPMQVIAMATRENAEFLGKGAELGTLAQGKLADILVVNEDPLRDINNIRQVTMVFKGGRQMETGYHTDYAMPAPKPKLERPLWVEKQIQLP
ncbi:MAG TPA: amidohydrolase family protein [Blastocatellia bacterium]|nr:amidohydrolase family protein [Blastocatellia bacterium]